MFKNEIFGLKSVDPLFFMESSHDMIKDGYYEGETTWMRLKVLKVGFLLVSHSCRTWQHHDVHFQRRNVIHSSPENFATLCLDVPMLQREDW